jgi:cytochrome c-type biogenesis protein CcmH
MKFKIQHLILFYCFLLFIISGLSLISYPSANAFALEPTPSDDAVNAIAHQLFCPLCATTPLDVCDTEACGQWRDLIRQMLTEGKTKQEIIQYFTDNYGVRVLSEPPVEGFNWLAYIIPPAAFLVGAFLLFRAFRIWKQLAKDSSTVPEIKMPTGVSDDLYVTRFEEELRKRK